MDRKMSTIHEAWQALQKDLDRALEGRGGQGALSEVRLSMGLTWQDELGWQVCREDQIPAHHLNLTLQPGGASPASAPKTVPAQIQSAQVEAPSGVQGVLISILGEPGFDNAARGSVLREVLEEMQETGGVRLAEALRLSSADRKLLPGELRSAVHRLDRLADSSPLGRPAATAALAGLMESEGLEALIEILARDWKTQEDWL